MSPAPAGEPDALEEVGHLALLLGRLLLADGGDTTEVQGAVQRFAAAYGHEARLAVTYETLLLTLVHDGRFRTKIGRHVPGMGVGLAAVEALNQVVDEATAGRLSLAEARARLTALEAPPATYSRWVVAGCMGLTAASLSRLFGGDWATFASDLAAGFCGMLVRQEMGARHANPFLVPFFAAFVSGIIGALGARLLASATPALCLVAPGMIIVPGVPLINGVRDAISNHMSLALARIGFAGLVLAAIALGLFAATVVTGVVIPIDEAAELMPVWEDAAFSALAALGYGTLFSVPPRLLWACVVCGIVSHTLRTALMHIGLDVITGTLIGALAVGLLSQLLAWRMRAPPAAFAFAGVVAMVPGSYAFRAVIGALQLARDGASTPAPLVTLTLSLGLLTALMTAAIAVGLAAPLALSRRAEHRER